MQAPVTATTPQEAQANEFRAVQGGTEIASGSTLLVEAYAVIWVILFGLFFLSWRRQARLEDKIADLERAVGKARRSDGAA